MKVGPNPFPGTKAEFDQLPANGEYNCPCCGLKITTPYPGCHCPTYVIKGIVCVRHINKWHHDCDKAWEHAYGRTK